MRRWIGLCGYLAILLFLQEAFFRWCFPMPELREFNRVHYMPLGASSQPALPVRNIRLVYESSPDHARSEHHLNYYGFRDKNWTTAKSQGVSRVMFVGSSFVEGALANEGQTLPAVYERAARSRGRLVEAMNFGINAAHWTHYDEVITDAVPAFRPQIVVLIISPIAYLVSPEEIQHRPPATFTRNSPFAPRIATLIGMLLRGEMLPLRWQLRSARIYHAVPDPNNPWTGAESELSQVAEPFIAAAILDGTFNPYRTGFRDRLAALLETPADFTAELLLLNEFVAANGARLVIAHVPDRSQVTRYYAAYERSYNLLSPEPVDMTQPIYQVNTRLLENSCAVLGIPFVDLLPAIKREEDAGHHLYWDYDDHFRPEGYELLGTELAGVVERKLVDSR
jgi:hypothetical protein